MRIAQSGIRSNIRIVLFSMVCTAMGGFLNATAAPHLPIIFIHGINTSYDTWSSMEGYFTYTQDGYTWGDDLYWDSTLQRVASRHPPSTNLHRGNLYTISFLGPEPDDWNSNDLTFEEQADQLKHVIDAVKSTTGFSKVILVGHSMGGLAA